MDWNKTILAYCLQPGQRQAVRAVCREQGIDYKGVTEAEYGQSLGSLSGIGAIPDGGNDGFIGTGSMEIPDEPMLLFAGLTDRELDACLQALRERQTGISLKAVLTPHNIFWTSPRLFAELKKERAQFQKPR